MDELTMIHVCTICGRKKSGIAVWFLLGENRWEDRLKVWQWEDRLAVRNGVYEVCSPAHVRDLVVHWMRTGSLCYPYQRVDSLWDRLARKSDFEIGGIRELGELYVHRESIRRVLYENPDSLSVILNELISALGDESKPDQNLATLEIAEIGRAHV